ncbi:MAG: hypothetical protein LBI17_02660 [Rickettsiales bacterium]|nr:hypothetical protein [Rickettsiales bacterium]
MGNKKMTGIKLRARMDGDGAADEVKGMRTRYAEFNRLYGFQKIDPRYIYFAAAAVSLLWAAVIWYYAAHSIYSVSSLLKMLPHEFGGFLAGTIMPIGFIWTIALYIDRNMNSNYEKEVIYPFLQGIIDPHGDASVITGVIREKIAAETAALKVALDSLAAAEARIETAGAGIRADLKSSLSKIVDEEKALGEIASNLDKSMDSLDVRSRGVLREISENVGLLLDATSAAHEKTADISRGVETAASGARKMADAIGEASESIASAAAMAEEKSERAAASFADVENRIVASAEVMDARASQVLSKIDGSAGAFVIKANIAAEKIFGAAGEIDSSISEMGRVSNENKRLALAALEEIGKHGREIADTLAEQSARFEDKTGAVLAKVAAVEERFRDISDLGGRIAAERDGFIKSAEGVRSAASSAMESIRSASSEISAASGNVKSALVEIDALMSGASRGLGEQAASAMKSAAEIKSTFERQIGDLEAAANAVSAQTRLGEMSIESQGEKLERIAEGLFVKVDAMGGKIAAAAGGILGMAERVDDKLRAMNEGIAAKAGAAAKMMADGVEGARMQVGAFGGAAAEIAESSRRASDGFGALIGELRQQTVALETATRASRELVASISSEIARAARAVPELAGSLSSIDSALKASGAAIEASADKAGEKGREVIGHLKEVGAQFSKFAAAKASEIEFIANSQTRAMTGVAQYANKLSNEARQAVDALARQYRDISGTNAGAPAAKGSPSSDRKDPDLFK